MIYRSKEVFRDTVASDRRTLRPVSGIALSAAFVLTIIFASSASAQTEPVQAAVDTAKGVIHVVQKGDTLWDLSEHYMNNPWLWPSIHKANSQIIADPHWIYPGQRIWFPIGGGTPVVLSFEEVWPDRETGLLEAARQALKVKVPGPEAGRDVTADLQAGVEEGTEPTITTPGVTTTGLRTAAKTYYPLASTSAILAAGYIGDPADWPEGKIISGSSGEIVEMNMSIYTHVFLDIGEDHTSVGDLLVVVESGSRVRHPEWRHILGRKIIVKGVIRIVDVEERTSQGILVAVFDAVRRKDRVIPAPEVDSRPWKEFVPVQGGRSGFVVARAKPEGNLHPYDMLFIDGGNEEGVQVGDLYVLHRPQTERGRLRFYEKELGRAAVIAVQEKTATLMILSLSESDIDAGEKVVHIGRSVFTGSPGPGL